MYQNIMLFPRIVASADPGEMMKVRPANFNDDDAIWRILAPVIRAGETYCLPCDMSKSDALAYWKNDQKEVFVVEADSGILGTYCLRANNLGHGDHICNCGYMTDSNA